MRSSNSRWRKKAVLRSLLSSCKTLVSIPLISVACLLFFLFTFRSSHTFTSFFASKFPSQCGLVGGAGTGERFLWYAPHSGFSNQLSELKNAILFAAILNRTLVIPPVLDHHAVALGSCPKFRVADPNELRGMVWDHAVELARSGRYISMGDIIDLSKVLSSLMVRSIDFRAFVSVACGLDLNLARSAEGSLSGKFDECRSLLSGMGNGGCVYAVQEDCRTTVWTYKQNRDDILDSFQPDEELQRKKKISYTRRRRDIYRILGPGSEAETATIIAFGSMFSAPYKGSQLYIDVHEVPADRQIHSLLQGTSFLPFVPEIMKSGKKYAMGKIKEPYLCAQLRLLDGQFKNHWKTTFAALKQMIQTLQRDDKGKTVDPVNIFIMTDLPRINWTGTYLAELVANSHSFKLHTLNENDHFVLQTARNVVAASYANQIDSGMKQEGLCGSKLPDILLFLEEAVCSCASLGFVGTVGSTIADNIETMRRNNHCINSL